MLYFYLRRSLCIPTGLLHDNIASENVTKKTQHWQLKKLPCLIEASQTTEAFVLTDTAELLLCGGYSPLEGYTSWNYYAGSLCVVRPAKTIITSATRGGIGQPVTWSRGLVVNGQKHMSTPMPFMTGDATKYME